MWLKVTDRREKSIRNHMWEASNEWGLKGVVITPAKSPLVRNWSHSHTDSANLDVSRTKKKQLCWSTLQLSDKRDQGRIVTIAVESQEERSATYQCNATECCHWGCWLTQSRPCAGLAGGAEGGQRGCELGRARMPAMDYQLSVNTLEGGCVLWTNLSHLKMLHRGAQSWPAATVSPSPTFWVNPSRICWIDQFCVSHVGTHFLLWVYF